MALIQPIITKIEVQLTDRTYNDTTIKQVATFIHLEHRQNPETGICLALVDVLVKSYANDNGIYGIYLNSKGVPDRTVSLVADNNTVVDAATGAIVRINPMPFPNKDWMDIVNAIADDETQPDIMYQGDFFWMLRETQSIIIGDLIRHHITQADAMGKFA